jgi:hypothetical protein
LHRIHVGPGRQQRAEVKDAGRLLIVEQREDMRQGCNIALNEGDAPRRVLGIEQSPEAGQSPPVRVAVGEDDRNLLVLVPLQQLEGEVGRYEPRPSGNENPLRILAFVFVSDIASPLKQRVLRPSMRVVNLAGPNRGSGTTHN